LTATCNLYRKKKRCPAARIRGKGSFRSAHLNKENAGLIDRWDKGGAKGIVIVNG